MPRGARGTHNRHEKTFNRKKGAQAEEGLKAEKSQVQSVLATGVNELHVKRLKAVLAHPGYVPAAETEEGRDFNVQALEWLEGNPKRTLTAPTVRSLEGIEYRLRGGKTVYGSIYVSKKGPVVLADFMRNPALLPMKPPGKKP